VVDPVIVYYDQAGRHVFRADATSPLGRLLIAIRPFSEITGFDQVDLALYILTGNPPRVPLASFEARSGRQVVVRFNSHRLNERQWREVNRKLRQAWGASTRQKAAHDEDAWLVEHVRELGGPPPRGQGVVAFWEKMKEEANRWRKRRGEKPYAHWRGPYMRYRRYLKRARQEKRRYMPEPLEA
jgi:hypothetical protein